jgi:hypothetical protein
MKLIAPTKPIIAVSIAIEFMPKGIIVYKAHPTAGYDMDPVPIGGTYIAGDRLADYPYEIGMEVLPRGWRELRDNISNGREPQSD